MDANDLKELQDMKRLLMVLLLKLGSTSNELAYALKVHPSRIRQLLPVKKIKKSQLKD
jgi:hypothetical protein